MSIAFAGRSDGLRIFQNQAVSALGTFSVAGATTLSSTLSAGYSTLAGANISGAAGANSWTYLQGNLNGATTNPTSSTTGFAFGWNASGSLGENVMTYFTGGGSAPRLDICSWDGTTRTTRLSIDNAGKTSIPGNLSVTGTFRRIQSGSTGTGLSGTVTFATPFTGSVIVTISPFQTGVGAPSFYVVMSTSSRMKELFLK